MKERAPKNRSRIGRGEEGPRKTSGAFSIFFNIQI